MNCIFNYSLQALEDKLLSLNLKKYNAKQIFEWIYKKKIFDFKQMTNLAKNTREVLDKNFIFNLLTIVKVSSDKKKEAIKFLFKLHDGNYIETVVMQFNYGYSICISTQVGCNMGCKFCASGANKKIRNLEPSEIVLQYLCAWQYLNKTKKINISNIVVMGIGEPFENYNNLIIALKTFINPFGLQIGQRHITVSTCGLIPKILHFAKDMPQVNLAISLHAANNNLRSSLMPINKVYNLNVLIETCKKYLKMTNRRLTFEYILLKNINDSQKDALALVKLLKPLLCYVNLIPYNETNLCNYSRSDKINNFFNILNKNRLLATIRLERGTKIDAACGQLRIKECQKKKF